jgi:hypothetical protein
MRMNTSAFKTLGLAAALSLATAVSAHALSDTRQLLVAGTSQVEGGLSFAGPGMSNVFGENFPGTGLGEQAGSIRMPAGSLSRLRVNVVTQNAPASGFLRVMLRINGANTTLTCIVTGTGTCNRNPAVAVPNNAMVTFRVSNNFVGSGFISWSATIEFG